MDEIERYLDQVCRTVGGSASLRRHIREELREHLSEAIEAHTASGMTHEDAVLRSIEDFGKSEMLRKDLQSVYGRRLVPLLIDKAMEWKEHNMKTSWKWSFAAHCLLAMALVAQVLSAMSVAVFFWPYVTKLYEESAMPLPNYFAWVFSLRGVFEAFLLPRLLLWLPLVIIAWGIIEWKWRSENKAIIRLTVGTAATLSVAVLTCVVATSSFLAFHEGFWPARTQPTESVIFRNVSEAEKAFEQLSQAVAEKKWDVAQRSATSFVNAFREMQRGSAAPTLAAMDRRSEIDQIRRLVQDVRELGHEVFVKTARKEPEMAMADFSKLRESYDLLKGTVRGWSGNHAPADERPR